MGIESSEGYLGHDEIDGDIDSEFLNRVILTPEVFTKGRVKSYKVKGRAGVVYLDTKTHRFISEEGLIRIISDKD